jgi:Sec-independent protein translocase protein TatA
MGDVALVLVVILIIVLIWRGPKTLPKLGEALGRGVREAKAEAKEFGAGGDAEDAKPAPTDATKAADTTPATNTTSGPNRTDGA